MKYCIKTFGCQMNSSDSERIAGFLEMQGLKSAKDIKDADLVVFNTCGVRQSAEDRAYGQIHNLVRDKRQGTRKRIIVLTGCLAHRKDAQRRLKNKVDLFVEINKLENLKETLGIKYKMSDLHHNYLDIKPKYANKSSAFVPIVTGCNNFCSYCVVPYARGREICRPYKDIISEIEILAKKKYQEITLLGQNVNSYSFGKLKFPALLEKLARNNPEINFKFLTSHPKDFSDELIEAIAKNRNIFKEIHLPIQSGSDKILALMNRPYTQKYYLNLVQKIKKRMPEAIFTTDVIVGFPGETRKDFEQSVEAFKKVSYSEAYINKYSPRPGTAAWKLKNTVSLAEKKRREKILRELIGKRKIIVILGPTSSGKSEVAIRLAKKFNGEIISADSRQIYEGMNIGTGKASKAEQKLAKHWMIDIANPKTEYNVSHFKKDANEIIKDILNRKKIPIICGGTGFWIKAIIDNVNFPKVNPDKDLRRSLENESAEKLFSMLKKLDSKRAKNIDSKNKVRLIRAIEIAKALGYIPKMDTSRKKIGTKYDFFQIGIDIPKEKLYKNIKNRLKKRFKQGMIKEVEKLHNHGLSWKKIQSFGLGYYWIPLYLQGELDKKELFEKIYQAEKDYAKRQMTWFRKDKRIIWLKNYNKIEKEIGRYINNQKT